MKLSNRGQISMSALLTIPVMLIVLYATFVILIPTFGMLDNVVGNFAYGSTIQLIYQLIPLILIILVVASIYMAVMWRQQNQYTP